MKKLRLSKLWIELTLLILSLAFLAPLIYILTNSFKPPAEIWKVPQNFLPLNWTLDNYIGAMGGRFGNYFANSVIITIGGVLLVTITASLAGYGFARLPFRGRGILLTLIITTLTTPLVILLIPMFLLENSTGLLNTNLGLILPNVAVALPFAILVMRAAFMGIPKEIEESATMDGAGVFRQWWQIMLPMARNGLVLVVIMATYGIWGEFILAKTLATNPPAMPLTVGLTLLKSEVWQFGLMAAVVVLAMLPPILMFIIFQKYVVAGVTQGALKG